MSFQQLLVISLGTILSLAVLVGLFHLKKTLRAKLFPATNEERRGEAMANLLLLQARLEGRAGQVDGSKEAEEEKMIP